MKQILVSMDVSSSEGRGKAHNLSTCQKLNMLSLHAYPNNRKEMMVAVVMEGLCLISGNWPVWTTLPKLLARLQHQGLPCTSILNHYKTGFI